MTTIAELERRALAAARAVASNRGVACEDAAIVYSGSNVMVHLAPSPVLARVMTGTVALHDDPRTWLAREVAVLRHLVPTALAVRPSPLIAPGPYEHDGLWLICVAWLDDARTPTLSSTDPRELGAALRALHDALASFPGSLTDSGALVAEYERLIALVADRGGPATDDRIAAWRAGWSHCA